MKAKKRQKLCHHCEGDVDLDVIVCPFCAADLREQRPEQPKFQPQITTIKHSTEQSLYPPAYSEPQQPEIVAPPVQEPVVKTETMPYGIVLFALGAQLLFLGLSFLFFSEGGTVLLRFNAHWWPLCLLFAIPLLVYGYRKSL